MVQAVYCCCVVGHETALLEERVLDPALMKAGRASILTSDGVDNGQADLVDNVARIEQAAWPALAALSALEDTRVVRAGECPVVGPRLALVLKLS